MTDNEIIKALECCTNNKGTGSYVDCPLANYAFEECADILRTEAYNLINRQKDKIKEFDERNIIYRSTVEWQAKEINRQKTENDSLKVELAKCSIRLDNLYKTADEIKSEAIKEFAERLKEKLQWDVEFDNKLVFESDIDNLVKEMMEGNNNG